MADTQEILDKTNAKIAEIQARIGSIGGITQNGTSGKDFLVGNRFSDSVIDGRDGDDRIFGGFVNDILYGDAGNDFVDGGNGDDILYGGDGNDNIFGKLGNDFLDGGTSNDLLDGSLGDDQLDGGDGNDQLTGGSGNDILLGGNGIDSLTGAGGNQTGGTPQQDILIGGPLDGDGNPLLDGSPDTFVLGNDNGSFYTSAGFDDYALILGFEKGVDALQLSPVGNYQLSLGSFFTDTDTGIFNGNDLIGIVVGVDLTAA
ncbi:MAG: hypothetical protein KME60_02475 [Cyanomargarita calcarea GSE-NOS-MK-12-04C]|jgi:Ca2+-binding RTX toxin-like protein|uniref:Calcium-binding protein n=1 Tax=Cyanomargarita calcarea GSE-NOS-MK-12-04C TaxID=2839659 RepID=A0A951QJV1_9CYAN|nr:hypothetical protein [Cyanomargarita calcarea GSE-NOS-MK-12-04C]